MYEQTTTKKNIQIYKYRRETTDFNFVLSCKYYISFTAMFNII